MDSDQLARIRAAIEADVDLDKQMTAPPWVSIDGNVETPDGSVAWATHDDIAEMDPWDAAGIAALRNAAPALIAVAEAAAALVAALDLAVFDWRSGGMIGGPGRELGAALARLAGEVGDG